MINGHLDKMYGDVNAFIVQEKDVNEYDQVKGRNMVASFRQDEIQKVEIEGNGESIYFAHNDDDELIGMNRVICSNITVRFDSSELSSISFITEPDSKFTPPQLISGPDRKLSDFNWRIEERPDRFTVMRLDLIAAENTNGQPRAQVQSSEPDVPDPEDDVKTRKELKEERKKARQERREQRRKNRD